MRIRSHVLKENPVSNFGTGHHCRVFAANLVEAVASRSEDSSGQKFFIFARFDKAKFLWNRFRMVVHHVVERTINTVIEIDRLGLVALATLSAVNFGGDRSRASTEVASWLCDVTELSVAVELELEVVNRVVDCLSNLLECRGVFKMQRALVVTGKTATDIDEAHGGKPKSVSSRKHCVGIIESGLVGFSITTARANVEADTNNVDSKLFGDLKKLRGFVSWTAKLV